MGYVYLVQLSNIIAITAILVRVDLYVYIKLLFLFFLSGLILLLHNLVYDVCQPPTRDLFYFTTLEYRGAASHDSSSKQLRNVRRRHIQPLVYTLPHRRLFCRLQRHVSYVITPTQALHFFFFFGKTVKTWPQTRHHKSRLCEARVLAHAF